MTRPFVLLLLVLVIGCTLGLLLTAPKIADSISGKVVRITYRIPGKQILPDVAQVYQEYDAPGGSTRPIPKILHHVYLDGLDSLQQAERGEGAKPGRRFPGYNSTWRHSCHMVHQNWQYMFWNNSQAENLIRTAYPWFLATFQSYNNNVQKGVAFPFRSSLLYSCYCS